MTTARRWTAVSDALPPLGLAVLARWRDGTEMRVRRYTLTDERSDTTITGSVVWVDLAGKALRRNDWPEEWSADE